MNDTIMQLYEVIMSRKTEPIEDSYTCYLFDKGIDKILKKVGEECSEVIIAAKNENNSDTVGEIGDLIYHLLVLMAQQSIKPDELLAILDERAKKVGNLKTFHQVEKNS